MVDFAASDSVPGQATLDRIVGCIRAVAEPELVMLFGSRCRGEAREESDYDLMVVLADESAPDSGRSAIRARFLYESIPVDLIMRTRAEYERNQNDPGCLDFIVAREGCILYSTGRVPQWATDSARVREDPPREGLAMWIRRAGSDLKIAEQSMASPEPIWDAICFHAHACAEKLLKAMIVRSGSSPPRTQDLTDLLELQPPGVRESAALFAACELLMRLLPNSRYPEDGGADAGRGTRRTRCSAARARRARERSFGRMLIVRR